MSKIPSGCKVFNRHLACYGSYVDFCHDGMAYPQIAGGAGGLHMWMAATNKSNKIPGQLKKIFLQLGGWTRN